MTAPQTGTIEQAVLSQGRQSSNRFSVRLAGHPELLSVGAPDSILSACRKPDRDVSECIGRQIAVVRPSDTSCTPLALDTVNRINRRDWCDENFRGSFVIVVLAFLGFLGIDFMWRNEERRLREQAKLGQVK
jgi:hypothetical protein